MSYFQVSKIVLTQDMQKFVLALNQNTKGHINQAQPIGRDLWLLYVRTIDRNEADYIRQSL